jgi:hypothetical protein
MVLIRLVTSGMAALSGTEGHAASATGHPGAPAATAQVGTCVFVALDVLP